jgi:hypothetical protein
MSALPPKADIRADEIDIRFVPLAIKVHRSKMSNYSSTSSAAVSSVGGTLRPSILAVPALMTNSNLFGCRPPKRP